jgi:phospholipid-translocating ATPase
LKVGFLFTYVAPLVFVLTVTMIKELYDDINRYRRDKELNETSYMKLSAGGFVATAASELKVGDVVQLTSKQRVPADLILLRTTNASGCSFIKTDQLDGETDWKL